MREASQDNGELIVFIIFWGIILIYYLINKIIKMTKQHLRDKAAHNTLGDSFNYEQETLSIKEINRKYGFEKKEIYKNALAKLTESHRKKNSWIDFVNSLKEKDKGIN
ncbi:MAG: hypothetical protein JXA96_07610 [Sedimentisphaerales bacterium]|nr:hypothetical protein [Sedimentisphaerales bacterium]